MLKISFVVPVFNVEKYLKECIESIREQVDDASCEIILIDDGSTDSSGRICDEYSEKYAYIKTIHKRNGGLASARNEGLMHVKGKYVTFVDSDDRIAHNSVKKILQWIDKNDADVCFMKASKLFPDGELEDLGECIYRSNIYKKSAMEVISFLSSRPKYPGSACFKLFKYSFIKSGEIKFPDDNRRSEDLGFSLDCYLKADSFDALEIPYYEYRQEREGSISNHKVNEKEFWDLSKFITESIDKLTKDKKPLNQKSEYAMSFVAYEYMLLLSWLAMLTAEEQIHVYNYLKNNRWVLNYSRSKKTKVVDIFSRGLGIKNTSRLLKIYLGIRK